MTKILKSSILLLSLSIILQVKAQQNFKINLDANRSNSKLIQKVNSNSNMSKYDVIYQNLYFTINPDIYYIKGNVSIYYQAIDNLDSLFVHLSDSLTVDSITQRNQKIEFTHHDNILKINIDALPFDNIDSLHIYYQGKPSKEHNAFFIAVQDSVDYIPVLSTLSEPYGSSDWWPCKNNLSDKIDSIDISINCPIENKAISLGLLKKTVIDGDRITYFWQHRYPVTPYLVSISVSNYYEYNSYIHRGADSLLFMNYLYLNNLENKKGAINQTTLFFDIYDSLFISYPFSNEKYGHVEFPIGGGMEHQTISSMGTFNFEIISHELAHQWFGDYITCGSWEDLWLNEGFATYCTGLCYENSNHQKWWPAWKAIAIDQITQIDTGSVFPSDTNNFSTLFSSRLTYRKAAYLLHMIRWTIGDDYFFQAIRNYLNDSSLSFSFANTPQLIAYFEEKADTSLSEFMNDWFYGEGYPIFQINWSQKDNYSLHLNINQTSVLDDGHFFKLFVPIQVIGQNDTLNLKLNLQENYQSFNFNLNFPIDTIIFDPYFWLITKNPSIIKESIETIGINIYPNPCQNKLIIDTQKEILKIDIIDSKGNFINAILNENRINFKPLASGIYFLRIETPDKVYLKKVIRN